MMQAATELLYNKQMVIKGDNQGAIFLSKNESSTRTKYVDVRYHFIRVLVEANKIRRILLMYWQRIYPESNSKCFKRTYLMDGDILLSFESRTSLSDDGLMKRRKDVRKCNYDVQLGQTCLVDQACYQGAQLKLHRNLKMPMADLRCFFHQLLRWNLQIRLFVQM